MMNCPRTKEALFLLFLSWLGFNAVQAYLPAYQTDDAVIVVVPGKQTVVQMVPYEVYDVFIPTSGLVAGQEYWVQAAFDGGQAIEIMMKRRGKEQPTKAPSFEKRYGMKLADHRYPSQFVLGDNGSYLDDPEGKSYEIFRAADNEEKYLVFTTSMIQRAHYVDEASQDEPLAVTLRLMTSDLDSFS